MPYYCQKCARSFRAVDAYVCHRLKSSAHNWCDDCDIDFDDLGDLIQHFVECPRHAYCSSCDLHFDDKEEFKDHRSDGCRWLCDRCNTSFRSASKLRSHKRRSDMHHECLACGKDFASASALVQHFVQSRRHAYCQRCDEHFDDHPEYVEHMDRTHVYCGKCNYKIFKNTRGLFEHYRQSPRHHFCAPCDKHFGTRRSLEQHWNSPVHR